MFPTLRRLCQNSTKYVTGSVSHDTKVGRLAKLIACESREPNRVFDFVALGEELIGKTVKAICMAQELSFPEIAGPVVSKNLRIVPYDFPAVGKLRPVPAVRFIVDSIEFVKSESRFSDIRVSTRSEPEDLAKKLHDLYMRQQSDSFHLRCMGYNASTKVIRSMTIFNQNVSEHKLAATISSELVSDSSKPESSLRVVLFRVFVIPTPELLPRSR